MKIIKRDCSISEFDTKKIKVAILKAMKYGSGRVNESLAEIISQGLFTRYLMNDEEEVSIYDVEKDVFDELVHNGHEDTARAYEGFRAVREFQRERNNTDLVVDELIQGDSEYWNTENSNKNSKLVTTQRDYLAGIVSTDIARRKLLTAEVVQAHDEGIIHFHDADYFAQNALTNCELINLEDMLQNGTVINSTMIEKPHRFLTAATIATQIITAVTSATYGGASISLSHLSPFVRDSYNRFIDKYKSRGYNSEDCHKYATEDTKKEIEDGVQTFNYQISSMSNTNGQSPFLTVFMYIGENKEYEKETVMIIEEFLKQRLLGMKNEKGIYTSPSFPKLIYVTEENNIYEKSPYFWLTKLSVKCSSKRLVPDYISEKEMKKLKEGNCYPVMGEQ